MKNSKSLPKVGDECWCVEWCTKRGMFDDNDPSLGSDPDKDENRFIRVATEAEAERIAREVYPQDQYGAVQYWPERFMPYDDIDAVRYPHAGFWEATADTKHYEGEATP